MNTPAELVHAHVFISYAAADQGAAETVRDDLESDGLVCWMSPRDIPAGSDYAQVIPQAIRSSQLLLLVLSASAMASPHVADHKIPILPIRVEPIAPIGALEFVLSGVQWIDAAPRLEPALGTIRKEVRRLVETSGVRLPPGRSRFSRVVASAAAWLIVIGMTILILVLMQGYWFNLVPLWKVPLAAARHPLALLVAAAVPLLALALQYTGHRNLRHVVTLDALFALGLGVAPRVRAAGALLCYVASLGAIAQIPPTVTIALEQGAIDPYNDRVVQTQACEVRDYIVQASSHYTVRLRVGAYNPPGRYALRLDVEPYATLDGLEFCGIWVDRQFNIDQLEPRPDDKRRSQFISIQDSADRFMGERLLLFTVTHSRYSSPGNSCLATAVVSLDGISSHPIRKAIAPTIWPTQ